MLAESKRSWLRRARRLRPAENRNAWRLLVGPEKADAPLALRNAIWIYDEHLEEASLQTPDNRGMDKHLYAFRGEISANGHQLVPGDSLLILGQEAVEISAPESADLILFEVSRAAPASRSGTLSG